MRKTAKPGDDLKMHLGPIHHLVQPKRLKQRDAAPLIIDIFGMFERHDEPHRPRCWHLPVIASGDGLLGQPQGAAIGGKGQWITPVYVPRHLIEQDDQAKCTLRRICPVIERTGTGWSKQGAKSHG